MERPCMVYVARAVGTDLVKIGASRKVQERLLGLQTGCPHTLELMGLLPGGYSLETFLHSMLKHRSVRGEWYQITDEEVHALLSIEFPEGLAIDMAHLREHIERIVSDLL
jgi:hypothetical protein